MACEVSTRKTRLPMYCQNCHEVKWVNWLDMRVRQFDAAGQWYCDECGGQPAIFTRAEHERSERQ